MTGKAWVTTLAAVVAVLVCAGWLSVHLEAGRVVLNPYEGIDWETTEQHRANLHTHTTHSDGSKAPHERIDEYHEHGYTILSLTDHDTYNPRGPLTYPWTDLAESSYWTEWEPGTLLLKHHIVLHNRVHYRCLASHHSSAATEPGEGADWQAVWELTPAWENRDPQELGMVAVQGVEVSSTFHIGSHFNDFTGEGASNEDYVLREIQARDGLAQFFHPGRYTHNDPTQLVDWFAGYFKDYDCLVGLEVFNRAHRYPTDRALWDNILLQTLPDTPVWGFAGDDNHVSDTDWDFLVSWTVFFLDELTVEAVKEAYRSGSFLACNRTASGAPEPPVVSSIKVTGGTVIALHATGYDVIRWIADGQVIAESPSVDVSTLDALYVRAELVKQGPGGEARTLTQPFALSRREPAPALIRKVTAHRIY